jgi:hypothetical protein
VPFIYNEEGKDFSLSAVRDQLKRFCLQKGQADWLKELTLLEGTVADEIVCLLERAGSADKQLAALLVHFSLPVTDMAFRLQGCTDPHTSLRCLQQLTLIQVYLDRGTDLTPWGY